MEWLAMPFVYSVGRVTSRLWNPVRRYHDGDAVLLRDEPGEVIEIWAGQVADHQARGQVNHRGAGLLHLLRRVLDVGTRLGPQRSPEPAAGIDRPWFVSILYVQGGQV
jgi:hypothetical protein